MPVQERENLLSNLSSKDAYSLLHYWPLWARPNQLAPDGDWRTLVWLAGRGFGKTRCGAEWVRSRAESNSQARIALLGRTAADVRDVMITGESGILAICPYWNRPEYIPSKRLLLWPNGARAIAYSSEKPDQLRGPQHTDAWCDELAAFRYPEALSNLDLGLRLGDLPRKVVTTTPKNVDHLKKLLKKKRTHIIRGSTFDNAANLAESFIEEIRELYEGTRLGRQELFAELLDDNPNALWRRDHIDRDRFKGTLEDLFKQKIITRIVVGVDPSTTSEETSAETGIIVAARDNNKHFYVLDDCSVRDTPLAWAREAVKAYHRHKAHRLVAETNQGGDMVEAMIRRVGDHLKEQDPDGEAWSSSIAYRGVRATQGKVTRAEPISALYEQGRVHHVGYFAHLEDQMCNWTPGDISPDRMDALVWALTELSSSQHLPVGHGNPIW